MRGGVSAPCDVPLARGPAAHYPYLSPYPGGGAARRSTRKLSTGKTDRKKYLRRRASGWEALMHLHTYRDESGSRHLDLIGQHWSVDLVTVTAASILVLGFTCAVIALWVR
jgi:hypothetical protein